MNVSLRKQREQEGEWDKALMRRSQKESEIDKSSPSIRSLGVSPWMAAVEASVSNYSLAGVPCWPPPFPSHTRQLCPPPLPLTLCSQPPPILSQLCAQEEAVCSALSEFWQATLTVKPFLCTAGPSPEPVKAAWSQGPGLGCAHLHFPAGPSSATPKGFPPKSADDWAMDITSGYCTENLLIHGCLICYAKGDIGFMGGGLANNEPRSRDCPLPGVPFSSGSPRTGHPSQPVTAYEWASAFYSGFKTSWAYTQALDTFHTAEGLSPA